MPALLVRLLNAYARHGYRVRTGLNPLYFGDPDASFTRLFDARGFAVSVGAGLAPQELHFLECLVSSGCCPERVLVIGNAFGWSAIALGMLLPRATIVAMDAGLEGVATTVGADLTRTLAAEEQLDIRQVEGLSPQDVARVVEREFGSKRLDFVLVDRLHMNDPLSRDFEVAAAHAAPDCVFVLPDVLSWHMSAAFQALPVGPDRERRILTRCPSGLGVVFPKSISGDTRDVINAFADESVDLAEFYTSVGATPETPGPVLTPRLASGWRVRQFGVAGTRAPERDPRAIGSQRAERDSASVNDVDDLLEVACSHMDHQRWPQAEAVLRRARVFAPERADVAQRLARVAQASGRHDEACEFFDEASRLRPEWASPQYDLGLMRQRVAGDQAAIPHFERARTLDSQWSAPCAQLAIAYFRVGDARAMTLLEEAERLDAGDATVQHLLGLAKVASGNDRAALLNLSRAASLNPTDALIHYDLGAARFRMGDLAEALVHLSRAVDLGVDGPAVHHVLGLTKRQIDGAHAGMSELERALTQSPDDANILCDVGIGRFHVGNVIGAVSCLEAAVAGNARLSGAHHALGLAYRALGNEDASLKSLESAVTLDPGTASVLLDLAKAVVAQGDDGRAFELLRRATAAAPEWAVAWRELGACAARLESWQDAAGCLRRAVDLGSADDAIFEELAVASAKAEAWDQALAAFTVVRRHAPEKTSVDKEIAICLRELGRLTESEDVLLHAVQAQPDWAGAHYELGRVYERMGDGSRAEASYRTASTLRPTWLTARAALNAIQHRRLRGA